MGVLSIASGNDAAAVGSQAQATAGGATSVGSKAVASNVSAVAIGANSKAGGVKSAALGADATAEGDSAVASGDGATAAATNSSAYGAGATVDAAFTNSSAFGTGAVATADHQMVFGTVDDTYQAPGITSAESRARQTGLLQLTTTDASGNLASDGGDVFTKIARIDAGVAMSMAMQAPALSSGDNFGVRVGYGHFDKVANAFGISAVGVLCRDCVGRSDRIAIDASAAMGTSTFYGYGSGDVAAARVGAQWTWK